MTLYCGTGKGITGIRKTTDAEKLYTCIQPTGKDGLTINGLDKKEYDENGNIEYFTDGALIRAPRQEIDSRPTP